MNDLFDDERAQPNTPEFSVSDIASAVKRTIEGAFSRVSVRGEVGRVMVARSGHVYFDLKDDRAVLGSVAWKGTAAKFRTMPEEGMEVVATGKISTFGGQSKYQLIVDTLEPAGLGALMAMLEKRRAALAEEGLFAKERKKPLPYLPELIGVVTSPQGAVIRDILHRLADRFPRKVLLWPVTVQGDRCAAQVAAAIRGFNALTPGGALPRPDLLIVARGGGSLEDLWGFNEEVVVRAAAESAIPLISAVGHETDTTLIDYAADRRAPTPTAAAEMAVPVRVDLMATLAGLEERRLRGLARLMDARRDRLRDLGRVLPRPQAILGERMQRFDAAAARLGTALTGLVQSRRLDLSRRTGIFGPRLLEGGLTRRKDRVDSRGEALDAAARRVLDRARDRLAQRRVPVSALQGKTSTMARDLARVNGGFQAAASGQVRRWRDRLDALERMRQTLGYVETLQRGYAVVRGGDGTVLPDLASASAAPALEVEFRDGRLSVAPDTAPAKPAAKARPKSEDGGGQGSLF